MIPIRTQPRFRCEFCRKTGIKAAMNRHERICFKNPNRSCDICGGKGIYTEVYGDLVERGDGGLRDDNAKCPFCYEFIFGKKEAQTV